MPRTKSTVAKAALALLVAAGCVQAHGPKTADEVKAFMDRQASAYHCAPAVAVYTAARKRSWAKRVLGGDPLSHQNLFVDGYFQEQQMGIEANPSSVEAEGKRLMECNPIEASRIKNATCVLSPQVTEGPYYHTEGHPIRSNIAENELGLLFLMNVGVIDVETCEPIPNILVDLWHANTTGYYAGHPNPAPDKVDEQPASEGPRKGLLTMYPRTIDEETWLRGAMPTDQNGVAEFTSIFPGYYTGRATHVHVKVHPEWNQLDNGTFTSGRILHSGQFFFDDLLNEQIDKIWPYSENPIRHLPGRGRTRNWNDSLKIYQESHANGYQPTFDVEFLGGVLQQGLIGYITMGINMSSPGYVGKWTPNSGKAGSA